MNILWNFKWNEYTLKLQNNKKTAIKFEYQALHAYSMKGWITALHNNLSKGKLRNLFWQERNLNLEFILFITWMAMVSPESVSSKMQPKYVTLDYCFILISLYWMFGSFHFLIFCLLPNKIDFVLYSPKWIVTLLSTNQPQSILKFLFIADSILIISLCSNIK